MFIRNTLRTFTIVLAGVVISSAVGLGNTLSNEGGYAGETQEVDQQEIRTKKERGLDLMGDAIAELDEYKIATERVNANSKELKELEQKKEGSTRHIQRLKIKLNHAQAKYTNNPQKRKVVTERYKGKIEEMKRTLGDIEKRIPIVTAKLDEARFEQELIELGNSFDNPDGDDTDDDYDAEFEGEQLRTFNDLKGLIK